MAITGNGAPTTVTPPSDMTPGTVSTTLDPDVIVKPISPGLPMINPRKAKKPASDTGSALLDIFREFGIGHTNDESGAENSEENSEENAQENAGENAPENAEENAQESGANEAGTSFNSIFGLRGGKRSRRKGQKVRPTRKHKNSRKHKGKASV